MDVPFYLVIGLLLLIIGVPFAVIVHAALKAPAKVHSEQEFKEVLKSYGILDSSSPATAGQDGSSEEQQIDACEETAVR